MSEAHESEELGPVKRALLEIRELRARLASSRPAQREPIAIVGAAVRLPGRVADLDAFWNLLRADGDGIVETPPDRWDADALFSADPDAPGKSYSRRGGFLADIDLFDAAFFGISPREAESMDPQHRLLLELSWEALERAAIPPHSLAGTKTGVFLGLSNSDYGRLLLDDRNEIDAYTSFGLALSIAAGRISYVLDARGPSAVVDTSCSSSLTAIHLACNSLALGEADTVIAGAANVMLSPEVTISFTKARMLAPDGRCKTFDATADGYVRGEGCVVVVLKRLRDAQAAGDPIMAVIRGSAINHDGRSAGLTAPNGPAQQAVIERALADAELTADDVDYVEAHGTGTSLGDPIELQALADAYGTGRAAGRALPIGSVKTSVGHLEAAAGLAGLVKVMLALEHERLPAHHNVDNPTSLFPWADSPLEIVRDERPWPRSGRPRRAGVSSFGFSGTNLHLIVEEAPAVDPIPAVNVPLFCISARTEAALRELAARYVDWLPGANAPIEEISRSANAGRSHHRHRLAVRVTDAAALVQALASWLGGEPAPGLLAGVTSDPPPEIAFVCPDRVVDADRLSGAACDPLFAPVWSDVLRAAPDLAPGAGARDEARTSAAAQIVFGRTLQQWGVVASRAIGTGSGTSVAAYLDGKLDLALALAQAAEAATVAPAEREHFDRAVAELRIAPGWMPLVLAPDESGQLDAIETLQRLYIAGVPIVWDAVHGAGRRLPNLPTYPFQRERYWRAAALPVTLLSNAPWSAIADASARQSETGPLGWDVASLERRWQALAELTAGLVTNALIEIGVFREAGERRTVDDILTSASIKPQYSVLMRRWLQLLVDRGTLERVGVHVTSTRALEPCDLAPAWQEAERLLSDDRELLSYVRRTSDKLVDMLTGRVSPLAVLFEHGETDAAAGLYERQTAAQYLNEIVAAAVRAVWEARDASTPFRVLEAGAGTGGTTSAIARWFPADGEYWFTDVSEGFFGAAEQKFGANPAFRFAKFDLEKSPSAELPLASCDVVVAANVVHATRDVGATLNRLKELLKPNGVLVLLETTTHQAAFDISISFIEGWSVFEDGYRSEHPLLDADAWVALAKAGGFVDADRFPRAGSAADTVGQHVIIARNGDTAVAPHAVPREAAPRADRDRTGVAILPAPELNNIGIGERRERLQSFVARCVAHVLHLGSSSIPGLRDHFTDLGMDSLMALQLKSTVGSRLGIEERIASTIAFDTGTVENMVEQLLVLLEPAEAAVAVKPAAPARVAQNGNGDTITAEALAERTDAEVEALLVERLDVSGRRTPPS
jgi:3-oxoacyl-(acyl-carrier-protein) synthase/SAM-dependent methyltransferase